MKKIITLILISSVFAFMLAGCGQAQSIAGEASNGKLSVISTIFAPFDFTREIVGDKADITMLLPPGSETHSFEPTAQDIIKVQKCDVFIHIGGESDAWVNKILGSIDTKKMKIITLMDCVETVEEEIVEGMEGKESYEAEYDEHVWTSPKNAKLIVRKISDTLCEVDAGNASYYRQNTENYLTELTELDTKFQTTVDNAEQKTIVFGDRFPFRYFVDAYNLDYFAAFPGCSAETEPSAATIAFLIDKIKYEKIPVVYYIELSNEKMTDTICEYTGAKKMLFHSCHNISKNDFISGVSYLELMTRNVEALKQGLNTSL